MRTMGGYDGTVRVPDPDLAWEIDASKLPEGYRAFVLYDQLAEEPDAEDAATHTAWANGDVYGVIVVRQSGDEQASLWGIYTDGTEYLEEDVVSELVAEIES